MVWIIRFPRVILARCVGMGLAVCGVVMQAVVKNPLADPYVLGISSGAPRERRKRFPKHRICQRVFHHGLHDHAADCQSHTHTKGKDHPGNRMIHTTSWTAPSATKSENFLICKSS